jgi:ankyrin repeat protein
MSSTQLLEEIAAFCGSESLSPRLREIIGRHGDAPKNIDTSIDYEFFLEACDNEKVTEGILRCLLEYFPTDVRDDDEEGNLPIHLICHNKNVTLGMVQLLVDAFPESLSRQDNGGWMPLHVLCANENLDEASVAVDILKLLIERYPESVRHAIRDGNLPIHFAAAWQSPEFCRILIEAYPGSERMTGNLGILPFHRACCYGTVATAKYLYQLYSESINVADIDGYYPIHSTIDGIHYRKDEPEAATEILQFLLDCDPNVALQKADNKLPLCWVCYKTNNNYLRSLNAHLKVLKMLYGAYPEAIESSESEVTSNVGEFCAEVKSFINTQLTYARQARDSTLMATRDQNGQLPLHKALCENAIIGSIKLLVKGNPSAVQTPDSDGALPLHLACLHDDDACIVEYLINLDPTSLCAVDGEGNTALHYACRGAKYETIALLLGKYGGVSVSKRNRNNQLPIDLLYESEAVGNRESIEYTESIFRLVRAYPDTVL